MANSDSPTTPTLASPPPPWQRNPRIAWGAAAVFAALWLMTLLTFGLLTQYEQTNQTPQTPPPPWCARITTVDARTGQPIPNRLDTSDFGDKVTDTLASAFNILEIRWQAGSRRRFLLKVSSDGYHPQKLWVTDPCTCKTIKLEPLEPQAPAKP